MFYNSNSQMTLGAFFRAVDARLDKPPVYFGRHVHQGREFSKIVLAQLKNDLMPTHEGHLLNVDPEELFLLTRMEESSGTIAVCAHETRVQFGYKHGMAAERISEQVYYQELLARIKSPEVLSVPIAMKRTWARVFAAAMPPKAESAASRESHTEAKELVRFISQYPGLKPLIGGLLLEFVGPKRTPLSAVKIFEKKLYRAFDVASLVKCFSEKFSGAGWSKVTREATASGFRLELDAFGFSPKEGAWVIGANPYPDPEKPSTERHGLRIVLDTDKEMVRVQCENASGERYDVDNHPVEILHQHQHLIGNIAELKAWSDALITEHGVEPPPKCSMM